MPKYEFSENNSGGKWWLNREDYENLFAAGWTYTPSEYDIKQGHDKNSFCKRKEDNVPYGWRNNLILEANSIREAVENWEKATGKDFFAEGCNCCGCPFSIHSAREEDTNEYESISGDSVKRQVIRPW